MKIAECISGFINIHLAVLMVIFFLNRLAGYQLKIKKLLLTATVIAISSIYFIPFIANSTYELAPDLTDLCSTVYFILIPYITLERKKRFTFLWIGIVLCSITEFINFIVCYLVYPNSLLFKNIVYCIMYSIVLIVIAIAIRRKGHIHIDNFFEQLPTLVSIMIFLACWAAFYGVTAAFDSTFYKDISEKLMLISSITVICCVSYIVFKYILASQNKKDAENQLNMQLAHYKEMMDKNKDIRRFKHDYKNNLFSLGILLDAKKIDEAKEYIETLAENLHTVSTSFASGNYLADAILSEKASVAEKKNISIELDGTIPENGITNLDLCTLLSNALDNAIEGSSAVAPCTIKIRAAENESAFAIKIENPVAHRVEIKNNKIKTSKADKQNHGLGIENIKNIVKKYSGFVELNCDDKTFTFEATMKLKRERIVSK